ncbi:hypothetical protein [Sphingomonas sp. UYEF23]
MHGAGEARDRPGDAIMEIGESLLVMATTTSSIPPSRTAGYR